PGQSRYPLKGKETPRSDQLPERYETAHPLILMHQQRNIKCPKKAMLVPELRTMSHWLSYASSEVDINLLGIIILMTSLSKIFEASWLNKMSEDCTSGRN